MRIETSGGMSGQQRVAVVLCLIAAFALMAPILASIVDGAALGARPGMFLVGCSALIGIVTLFVDPLGKRPYMAGIRNALLILGVGLFLAWPILWS